MTNEVFINHLQPQSYLCNGVIPHYHFDEIASTNTMAKSLLKQIQNGPTGPFLVVTATAQTHGRGQFGRTWESKSNGGLYYSFGVLPQENLRLPDDFPFRLAQIVARVIHALTPITVEIKPPNDVMIHGKKLAGILVESNIQSGQIQSCVVGIGLNINQLEFTGVIQETAVSLRQLLGKTLDPYLFIELLTKELCYGIAWH